MEFLYVCLFSSGHIKVGQSLDPLSRIAAHADRVKCVGVELRKQFMVECAGAASASEAMLIDRCAAAAETRFFSEWFAGLDFDVVCGWARECAATVHEPAPDTPLRRFLARLPAGGISRFAEEVGIGAAYLSQIAAGREPSPPLCIRIEKASGGDVSRLTLRADAHVIWDYLVCPDSPYQVSAPNAVNTGESTSSSGRGLGPPS